MRYTYVSSQLCGLTVLLALFSIIRQCGNRLVASRARQSSLSSAAPRKFVYKYCGAGASLLLLYITLPCGRSELRYCPGPKPISFVTASSMDLDLAFGKLLGWAVSEWKLPSVVLRSPSTYRLICTQCVHWGPGGALWTANSTTVPYHIDTG